MNSQLLHQTREESLKKLKVIIREGNPNGHCLNPQIHVDPREERREKRRYPFKILRGEMKAPPSRNTLPLIDN